MRQPNQQGFSLIELILAATFIAVAAAGIITLFTAVTRLNRQSQNLAIATQLVQQKLEEYRNTPYTSITPGNNQDFSSQLPPQLHSPRSAFSDISELETGLKQIDVTITYQEDRVSKKVRATTYVTARGLNR